MNKLMAITDSRPIHVSLAVEPISRVIIVRLEADSDVHFVNSFLNSQEMIYS